MFAFFWSQNTTTQIFEGRHPFRSKDCPGLFDQVQQIRVRLEKASFLESRCLAGITTQHCFVLAGATVNITGLDARNYGRVEVTMDGESGAVCNTGWRDPDSRVLCRSLGFTDGVNYRYLGPVIASGIKIPHMCAGVVLTLDPGCIFSCRTNFSVSSGRCCTRSTRVRW